MQARSQKVLYEQDYELPWAENLQLWKAGFTFFLFLLLPQLQQKWVFTLHLDFTQANE